LGNKITPVIHYEEQPPMTTVAAGQGPGIGTPAELETEYQHTYPGRADQVRHVRHDVARHLGECPVADEVMLIASELAANAVLHSRSRGGHFTIRVKLYGDYVRLECQDAGGAWPARRRTADRPHGLDIVEALTGPDHWGTERTPDDTRVVWATLEWS
jgi:anti-sigma regulatory factor (Ser/Thr protein kinase)